MRVLLVEDHAATREAVAAVLRRHGLELHTAGALQEVDPDVEIDAALIDLRLGEDSGLDLIRTLSARQVPCLVLTQFDDATTLMRALQTGARGYLLKTDPPELIVTALHQATDGQVPLSAAMTHHLLPKLDATPANYTLVLDPELRWVRLEDGVRSRLFRSETQVALLYALGRHRLEHPDGWLDNHRLAVAVWGRRHLSHHPNNLNVLMHRLRRAASDAGLGQPFLENREGRSRLQLATVRLDGE